MKRLDSNLFSADPGEVVTITVTAVNIPLNVGLGNGLIDVSAPGAKKGQLKMGGAQANFSVTYTFPDPVNDGGKYVRTVSGSNGGSDVSEVFGQPDQIIVLPYSVQLTQAAGA